jgi:hypothetical protein
MSDDDVQALKEFRAEMDQFDVDGARARVRHRIARAGDNPTVKRRWVPIASAAAAAAVLIGTFAVFQSPALEAGSQPGPTSKPYPTGGPIPSGSPRIEPTRLKPSDQQPVNLPRADPAPLTAEGLTLADGQLLYARQEFPGSRQEQWAEPGGTIVIAIQRTDGGSISVSAPESEMKRYADPQRAQFRQKGPSVVLPTRQYLATGLPKDAAGLKAKLAKDLSVERPDVLMKDVVGWLYGIEPLLTPQVRTELIAALDLDKNIRVDHTARTFQGRPVYLVLHTASDGTDGLIVDVATGRIIGSFTALRGQDPMTNATHWEYAVVTR